MTRLTKFLTALTAAIAIVGVGSAPALAENHLPGPLPSQPAGN
ncbi:hypothetical protein SAMN05192584_101250 [Streptomyces pini]|uniref:Uncharacterized protein n=1 Tax=Streptomyces pini TaxID=1520580 RepID=A0A1I3U3U6_9ACTN|nr:hypothetical protein SAMN05192584_101250 [Streptomyces pini]